MPAPKKNQYAKKPDHKLKPYRCMINFTEAEHHAIKNHLGEIAMTWNDWSRAVIRQAIADES